MPGSPERKSALLGCVQCHTLERVVKSPHDTKTGTFTEYLLPRPTNIRRVFVDNSTTPRTFWVGNNHGASVIKLEPLD